MKISLDWLADFVDFKEDDPQAIADRLTIGAGEVEEVETQGALLKHCVVGKVTNLRKHPGADKLSLCDVQTEQGPKQVVCGGTNVHEGMLVAFAHVGATVKWHGGEAMTLTLVKIRGEQSEGMICAAEELGLEHIYQASPDDGDSPIMNLSKLEAGTPLRDALGLTDTVLHIDNHAITNRPDLFSHIGVARELVALGLATSKKGPGPKKPTFPKTSAPFTVHNDAKNLVPFYAACMLHIDSLGKTPDWMKRRLEATGWRSINLPIDITNYVLMEVGMPLHGFDTDDLKGDVHLRQSKKGETMTTLDGVQRPLPDGMLVLSDDTGIFDLFCIMGGLRSSMKQSTKNILLQAAIPSAVAIRHATIALGHRTDAATVYEKGVPHCTSLQGLHRAIELFLELCPGARIASKHMQWGTVGKQKPVKISHERINRTIGEELPATKIKTILTNLGFAVGKSGTSLSVTPPDWRKDVTQAADVIEEIARIHGYDRIPASVPSAELAIPRRDVRQHNLRDTLKECRYVEMLHLAFANTTMLTAFGMETMATVSIENPIGEETSLMRPSLLPSLALTAGQQLKHCDGTLKLYEIGHVFAPGSETSQLCMLVAAKAKTTLMDDPLLVAKADLQHAFGALGYAITVEQKTSDLPSYAHPGRSAKILCNGTLVGLLTQLSPQVQAAADLPYRTACAVIDWDAVLAIEPTVRLAKPLPSFPAVTYDETLAIDPGMPAKKLIEHLRTASPLLESVEIVSLYQQQDDRRMTLHFTYRAKDRTLQQDETDAMHAKVLSAIRSESRITK